VCGPAIPPSPPPPLSPLIASLRFLRLPLHPSGPLVRAGFRILFPTRCEEIAKQKKQLVRCIRISCWSRRRCYQCIPLALGFFSSQVSFVCNIAPLAAIRVTASFGVSLRPESFFCPPFVRVSFLLLACVASTGLVFLLTLFPNPLWDARPFPRYAGGPPFPSPLDSVG